MFGKLINRLQNYEPSNNDITVAIIATTSLIAYTLGLLLGLHGVTFGATTPPTKVYIDSQSVVIEYDYSRLNLATCHTDQECHIADILHRYNTGQLVDTPQATYEVVLEPTN